MTTVLDRTNPESSFGPDGKQWAWDSTSLKRAETCPRKYQYQMLEGWQSPYRSVHLWFGGLYATALEHYHELRAKGASHDEALNAVVHEALVSSWDHDLDEEGNRIPETGGPAQFDHASKNRATLIRTIIWYFEEFANDVYETYITADGKPAVEHSFRLPVDNGLTFCGHIDRLCVDPAGEIFVHDQKTTGTTLSPRYFNGFKPDSQFSMYTFAGKMIYNAPVKGVIIDAAQIAVGFTRFGRAPTYRTDDELNEWYDESMLLIERIWSYHDREFFPRNPASCSNFGGCEFRDVCSRPPAVRHNFLDGSFVKGERWNPIKPR